MYEPYDPNETITEGTITEEQWKKIHRLFKKGEQYGRLYQARQRGLKKRVMKFCGWTNHLRKEGETKRGR